jgi:uncharacterized membrane protein YphA (DoxX/SURF4 family)
MRSLAIDPALQLALRLALGAVLLQAAAHKLRDVAAFASAIAAYRLLPERRSRAAAAAFAVAELAIGCALLLPAAGPLPSVAAGALIAVYSLAVAVNLARGRREIDCGCAGPAARQPLRGSLLVRNAALVAMAAICALPATSRSLLWIDALTIAAGTAALWIVYVAVETALSNAARLGALRT